MTETFDAVAREVQRAVEQMPYRDFTELTADGSAERPTTLREFFENTWQGEHADEVFSAAANVATRAAITALDPEAIAKDATRAAALSDLIAECAVFLDRPDTLADSDGA